MELTVMLRNASLDSTLELFTAPDVLEPGSLVYDSTSGSSSFRLTASL